MSRALVSVSLFSPPTVSWRAFVPPKLLSLCLVPEAERVSSIKLKHAVLRSLNSSDLIVLGGGPLVATAGQSAGICEAGGEALPATRPGPCLASAFSSVRERIGAPPEGSATFESSAGRKGIALTTAWVTGAESPSDGGEGQLLEPPAHIHSAVYFGHVDQSSVDGRALGVISVSTVSSQWFEA